MDPPPNSRIPTSNETRVRVEDLENTKAQIWPASGWLSWLPRCFLIRTVSARICSMSARPSFSRLKRCFIPTLWQSGGHGFNDFQSFFRLGLPQVQRREKPQNLRPGRDHQQPRRMQQVGEPDGLRLVALAGQIRNIRSQLRSDHQAETPHVLEHARILLRVWRKAAPEIPPNVSGFARKIPALNPPKNLQPPRAGRRGAAIRCPVR